MDIATIGYGFYVTLAVIFLFGVTIFVHELGHFIVARLSGMVIEVFSIGFGPAVWKKKIHGIWYKIGLLPLGGYVALPQMDPSGGVSPESADSAKLKTEDDKQLKEPIPPLHPGLKILVALAGATGNILLAFLLAFIVYFIGKPSLPSERSAVIGFVEPDTQAYAAGLRTGHEILSVNGHPVSNWQEVLQENAMADEVQLDVLKPEGTVSLTLLTERGPLGFSGVPGLYPVSLCRIRSAVSGSSAEQAGLQPGDTILEFDGERVYSVEHLIDLVASRPDKTCSISVQRGSQILTAHVTPRFDATTERALIGIHFDPNAVEYDQVVHVSPLAQIRSHAGGIFRFLGRLITPSESKKSAENLGGPIMIIYMFQSMVRKGIVIALWFTCFLNVNLAILNILPLPVLDGGHILFSLIEWLRGKPLPPKAINWLAQIFFALLLGVFVLLSWRDVQRLVVLKRYTQPSPELKQTDTNEIPEFKALE